MLKVGDLVTTKFSFKYGKNERIGRYGNVGLVMKIDAHHPIEDNRKYVLIRWVDGCESTERVDKIKVLSSCK